MSKIEISDDSLNRVVELILVASYIRTACNKLAAMDIEKFSDDGCKKIQNCVVAMEDAAMLLYNEKFEILKEAKVKKET